MGSKRKQSRELTPKQRRFVEEYCVDFNATQAAIRAGYSERCARQMGYEAIRREHVQEAISERMRHLANKAEISSQRVLEELARIGFANMLDYVRITPEGEAVVDLNGLTREQAAAIQEITVEDFLDGRGDGAREVRRVRFKLADKRPALELLGKYLALWVERVHHSGSVATARLDMSDEELMALVAGGQGDGEQDGSGRP